MCHAANTPVAVSDRFALHDGYKSAGFSEEFVLVAMVKGSSCNWRASWESLCTRIHVNPKQHITCRTRSLLVIEICAFSSLFFTPVERNRICWILTLYPKHTWTLLTIARCSSFSELTRYLSYFWFQVCFVFVFWCLPQLLSICLGLIQSGGPLFPSLSWIFLPSTLTPFSFPMDA